MIDGLTILDGQMVEAAGLRLLGVGDPRAASYSAQAITPAKAKQMAEEINRSLAELAAPPDVLAVHNHRVGMAIRPGLVPVVLFGHSHTPMVAFRGGTAYINAGTTGERGYGGWKPKSRFASASPSSILKRRKGPG